MDFITLFILSGLIYQGTIAMECYHCSDCQGGIGEIYDCTVLPSTSCYLTKTISTGVVAKSCGIDINGVDVFGLPEECVTEGDSILCRCTTNLCNTIDLLPSSTTPLTTQQGSVATTTEVDEGWYCYQCVDCGTSTGVLTDCSTFSTSRTCYLIAELNGDVLRTCGTAELDHLDIELGCVTVVGYTFCKCTESRCNKYPEFSGTTVTSRRPPSTTTTTSQLSTTGTSEVTQTRVEYCYECADCKWWTGAIVQCNDSYRSIACYYWKNGDGEAVRTCGRPELEELGFVVGCQTFDEYYVCKCTESGCNDYTELADPPVSATTDLATQVTEREPFYCYTCSNCGSSYGTLTECSLSHSSRTCYYSELEDGTRLRHCGTQELDAIDFSTGCSISNTQNFLICKCTESECNKYPSRNSSADISGEVAQEEPWYCYVCHDCGSTVGRLVQCSQFFNSSSCYYWHTVTGRRMRSCGTSEFEEFNLRVGWTTGVDVTVYKCVESGCNKLPLQVDGTEINATTTSTTTLETQTTQTLTTVQQPNQWFCYVCTDCGDSAGTLQECSQVSRSCLLSNSSSGTVSRGCGQEAFDERPDGCYTDQGTTFCKCSQNGCNGYPEYTKSNEVSTTTSLWYCYICVNCGTSLGDLLSYAGASSCSFIVEDNIVTRSCGSATIDFLIPEPEGCQTAEDGTIICKCSTRGCNLFLNSLPDTTIQSGSIDMPIKWLVCSLAICLVTIFL